MTVSTTTNKQSYTGNNVTVLFGFPIPFIAATDLQVYVNGVLKTLTTDYTISGSVPYPTGANVTFNVAPALAAAILIVRTRPYTQTLDLVPNDPLPADTVEQLLGDHMVMLIQQLKEITDRSFALAITDTSGASVVVPTPVASNFLGWNAAGNALQNYAAVSGVATTAYWAAILATTSDLHLYAGSAAGTANALTATTSPTFTPVAGNRVTIKATANNTLAATFGLNGQTPVGLRVCGVAGLVALAGGEIVNGESYDLFFDGTFWLVLDPSVEITQTTGDNTRARATTAFVTTAIANANTFLSGRNRIINGAITIDQRNSGASFTPTSGQYCVDRFACFLSQASKYSVQQSAATPPAGFTNYLRVTSSSAYSVLAADFFFIAQRIEGINVADLAFGSASAQSVTLSFWARSSLTGTFGGALQNSTGARCYPFSYSIPVANVWTKISVVIAGDTTGTWLNTVASFGLQVVLGLGIGSTSSGPAGAWAASLYDAPTGAISVVGTSGATFDFTGVQLEPGTVATAFEQRDYQIEFARCQRYFQTVDQGTNSGGMSVSTSIVVTRWIFPVVMITTPTVAILKAGSWIVGNDYSVDYTATTVSINANNLHPSGGRVSLAGFGATLPTAGTAPLFGTDANGTAVLGFSAEL